ncbi:MAG: hypothetical protein O7H40_18510 [Gammaproteobacteria bacterium]|nr:hypothetical protein [Gammaproteobacteria bacterium]
MAWPRFTRFVLFATLLIGVCLYAFILILDPYQNVPFSPALNRAPVSTNQRFAYPALARELDFDGAIIGTSTVRLLDPARLGQLLDARFVNLAMNSATAYEQTRIHEVFVRHHPAARYLVFGIDETWCNRADTIKQYTFRAFPEWMYDENRWNDLLYLFNDKALENAVRMLELLTGRREPKYRLDGYRDFTGDFGSYDLAVVRERLYGTAQPPVADVQIAPSLTQPGWDYPLLDVLRDVLNETPAPTRIILLFPPLHSHYVAGRIANLRECKGRLAALLPNFDNVAVLDFMHISPLTRADTNYWDPLHFTNEVAVSLERDIARVLERAAPLSKFARDFSFSIPAGDRP